MTSLSDTLTMGIVLALVFGSIVFYIYSRLLQVEKRMNLTENILLDLKMATENTLFAMGPGPGHGFASHRHDNDNNNDNEDTQNERIEAISEPIPVASQEVEELGEDDFYKSVLANTLDTQLPEEEKQSDETPQSPIKEIQLTDVTGRNERASAASSVQVTKMEPNYESMSLKELKALAKQRGISITSHAGKKEVIDSLKKGIPEAGSPSSSAFPIEGAEILE